MLNFSSDNHNRIKISHNQFLSDIKKLADLIPKGRYTGIVAITGGALVPSYYLSKLLGIKKIEGFSVHSYEDYLSTGVKIVGTHYANHEENWLILDDLVDSGETMQVARNHYPSSTNGFAVLYTKKGCGFQPTYSVREYSEDKWLDFFWETDIANFS